MTTATKSTRKFQDTGRLTASSKRLKSAKATRKPGEDILPLLGDSITPERIRDASINNAAMDLMNLIQFPGFDLEFHEVDGRSDRLRVSCYISDLEPEDYHVTFDMTGDNNREMIKATREFLARLIGRLKLLDAYLKRLTPSPLPTGVWVSRDKRGKAVSAVLYPFVTDSIPKGCTQNLEPLPEVPAV